MDIQRLRSLTTGILHTPISDVYEDIAYITGEEGIMTHRIPDALTAIKPWLRQQVLDTRFWDERWDSTHIGQVDIRPMNNEEKALFFKRFRDLLSLLSGHKVPHDD
jgi:hypothetical protein